MRAVAAPIPVSYTHLDVYKRQPISIGNVSVTILQLSNIAWEVNRELQLDAKDGRIQGDPQAMKMWGREYEKGWAPHI